MNLSPFIEFLWVRVAAIVALLPMRRQYEPGVALLVAAPCLPVWIARDPGAGIFGAGLFAVLSMFRTPLFYVWRRAGRDGPEIPS